MEAVVVGIGERRILTVVCEVGIGATAVVGADGDAGWHVLIDAHDEVESTQVLVGETERGFRTELTFDLQAYLLGVGVLKISIDCGEVCQQASGTGGEDGGEDGRATLGGREAETCLSGGREIGCVVTRQQRVG